MYPARSCRPLKRGRDDLGADLAVLRFCQPLARTGNHDRAALLLGDKEADYMIVLKTPKTLGGDNFCRSPADPLPTTQVTANRLWPISL